MSQAADIHIDDKLVTAQEAGQEAVAKLQSELENKVQKYLD